jgi:conjugal transfer pilus assembly protein TraK
LPAGYRLRKAGRGERAACRQPEPSVTTAQVLEGGGLRILAARARNQGKQPVDLEEGRCTGDSDSVVAAVAAWPRSRLAPGEETELYVALRPRESGSERGERPSLLVTAPKDERATGTEERRGQITNLLNDADSRAIGIEARPASSGA